MRQLGTLNCTERYLRTKDRCDRPIILPEFQMSKRKPVTVSKHARSPKIIAKPHRTNQAVVGSPETEHLLSAAAGSNESPPDRHNDTKQEAPLVEDRAIALQDDFKQTMRDDSKKGFDFSSATANVRAYQAKLLEMGQANIQLAFEFAERLAAIRSPLEIFGVIAEFTGKRIAMFGKYSKEMAELPIGR
jgi:Phasin protein